MPGGVDDQIPALVALLKLVDEHGSDTRAPVAWPTSRDSRDLQPLKAALRRMGRIGLIHRTGRTSAAITGLAKEWIQDPRPERLIEILHANVQFIGELMAEVANAEPLLSHEKIKDIATQTYQLPWESVDPARRRTTWLRAAGLLELRFDNTLVLTDKGRAVLERLEVLSPERLVSLPDAAADTAVSTELESAPLDISRLLEGLDRKALVSRKKFLGYVPRSAGIDIIDSLRFLVSISNEEITREEFYSRCGEKYEIRKTSARSALSMLLGTGLIRQTTRSSHGSTEIAKAWLSSGNDIDIVRILHAHIIPMGELLYAVEEHDTAPKLAAYSAKAFNLGQVDVNGVRTRIHILMSSGLLTEVGWGKFKLTSIGRAFRDTLPILPPISEAEWLEADVQHEKSSDTDSEIQDTGKSDGLARKLLEASRDGEHSEKFERVVCQAFQTLGFEAERLGGPGRTDVLVTYSRAPGDQVTVVVDAKCSTSGVIEERHINFDTIGEHRKVHKADKACIVGPGFNQSRLPSWARDRDVSLVTADVLADALRRQSSVALGTRQLARIFDAASSPIAALNEEWKRAEQGNALFSHVIAALSRESVEADDVTHGSLSIDNLYFLLRSELEFRPQPSDIEAVVQFLRSPLLNAVLDSSKDKYVAEDHPEIIARKLNALALAARRAADLRA